MRAQLFFVITFLLPALLFAQIHDPYDAFDSPFDISVDAEGDKEKSAHELLEEAELLFVDERPLDARTKLLRALKKDPSSYKVHKLLSGYYLAHVGHFRLSLKYIKQAQKLFREQRGNPPYQDPITRAEHAHLLYFLSQIRLNLDNYQGALDVLDQFAGYGYYADWYPGSRAWILMKLGRLQEAIKVARMGMLAGAEKSRTLNMLGILLSMTGQREQSLAVFREAIAHELSLGRLGNPATPLNNSGEVYRETFQEDKAERSWLRATSMPDGCEHVLPSLNLVILYIEQTKYQKARKAIDNFEACVAQFPLRNGEEHKAFVHLARGRIAMHTGRIDEALEHFRHALEKRQWFGKIGTSTEDLRVAASISYAQALKRKNKHLKQKLSSGILESLDIRRQMVVNALSAWWHFRTVSKTLAEDLNGIEDLFVRHTDSMIEYPTFGEALSLYPYSVLEKKIEEEKSQDKRPQAELYYRAYLAENLLERGSQSQAIELLDAVIAQARHTFDEALKLHVIMLRLSTLKPESQAYQGLALQAFLISPAAIRNYGQKLPVQFEVPSDVKGSLKDLPFVENTLRSPSFILRHRASEDRVLLELASPSGLVPPITVQAEKLEDAFTRNIIGLEDNKLLDELFRSPA